MGRLPVRPMLKPEGQVVFWAPIGAVICQTESQVATTRIKQSKASFISKRALAILIVQLVIRNFKCCNNYTYAYIVPELAYFQVLFKLFFRQCYINRGDRISI